MKIVIAIATLLVSVSSFARSPMIYKTYELPVVEVNGFDTHLNAVVQVNFMEGDVSVVLRDGEEVTTEFSAPIIERKDSCGSIYYTAYRNQLPADGYEVSIEVADHTRRLCFDMPAGLIEVDMTTTAGWTLEKTTYRLLKH